MLTLVTGATGLLGNNVVRMLLGRAEAVRVLVRDHADPRPLDGLDVEVAGGDVRDRRAVDAACKGADAVIHAAGVVHIGWSRFDEHQTVNVEGTRNVARAARDAGARMVHVSSIDALGLGSPDQPADEETPVGRSVPCPYVLTKRKAEQVLLEEVGRGLDAVIVNPSMMFGPWDWKPSSGKMLLAVAKSKVPLAPRGVNNFCDVRDVAAGILTALQQGQTARRYILGGWNMTFLEAWRVFAEVVGVRRPWREVGPWLQYIGGRAGDLWGRISGREPDVNSASAAMARLPKYYSSARAETELGYRARPLEQAARAAWDWFGRYGYA